MAEGVAKAGKHKDCEELRKTYVATCKSVREAPVTTVHADDRDPQYLIALNQVQSWLEGEYKNQKSELEKGIKLLEKVKV